MSSEIIPNSIILFTRAQLGRTATPTPEVEIESCPECPRAFPFWNGVPFLLLNHSIMSTIWHPLSLVAEEQGIIDSISCFEWLTYPEVTDMSIILVSQTYKQALALWRGTEVHPKGVSLSGLRYIKGKGLNEIHRKWLKAFEDQFKRWNRIERGKCP